MMAKRKDCNLQIDDFISTITFRTDFAKTSNEHSHKTHDNIENC